MKAAVPFEEAILILRHMAEEPAAVRALQDFDAGTFGPRPFFTTWEDEETEVTLDFAGGVILEVVSVRVGARFSNDHDWTGEASGNPWHELSEAVVTALEVSLLSAAARA